MCDCVLISIMNRQFCVFLRYHIANMNEQDSLFLYPAILLFCQRTAYKIHILYLYYLSIVNFPYVVFLHNLIYFPTCFKYAKFICLNNIIAVLIHIHVSYIRPLSTANCSYLQYRFSVDTSVRNIHSIYVLKFELVQHRCLTETHSHELDTFMGAALILQHKNVSSVSKCVALFMFTYCEQ